MGPEERAWLSEHKLKNAADVGQTSVCGQTCTPGPCSLSAVQLLIS